MEIGSEETGMAVQIVASEGNDCAPLVGVEVMSTMVARHVDMTAYQGQGRMGETEYKRAKVYIKVLPANKRIIVSL